MAIALLTVEEAAARVRFSPKTIYRAIRRGDLPGHKLHGRWRIEERDFDAWVEGSRYVPAERSLEDVPVPSARGSREALLRIEAEAA